MATIYLLKDVSLDTTFEHTIDFPDAQTQFNYFQEKVFDSAELPFSFSYLRENQPIKYPKNKDLLFGCNYLMYKNETLNLWFYCFITSKEYLNEGTTILNIKTDPLQTFMFNYSLLNSFVKREHQDRWDATSPYLVPKFNRLNENLELGKNYELKEEISIAPLISDNPDLRVKYLLIICQDTLGTTLISEDNTIMPYDSLKYYALPFNTIDPGTDFEISVDTETFTLMSAKTFVNNIRSKYATKLVSLQLVDYIPGFRYQSISATKYKLIATNTPFYGGVVTDTQLGHLIILANGVSNSDDKVFGVFEQPSFDRKTLTDLDINNLTSIAFETKLLTVPYSKYLITNLENEGLNFDATYIEFNKDTGQYLAQINCEWCPAPDFKQIYYIYNYLGDKTGAFYNLILNDIVDLPIVSDKYAEYMANHRNAATTGLAVNSMSEVVNSTIGGFAGGVVSGIVGLITGTISASNAITQERMKQQDLKDAPDNVKALGNNGKFKLQRLTNNYLYLQYYTITDYYLNLAFQFFMKYGYLSQEMKVPNLKSRYYYNFIQTVACEIDSNIDQDYIDEIKSIYDKGITIWHYRDASTFKGVGNYDYENVEMSIMEAQQNG